VPFRKNKSYTTHPSTYRYRYVPSVLGPITNLLSAPASLVHAGAAAPNRTRPANRTTNSENPNGNQ
jgi:hypothetical protein